MSRKDMTRFLRGQMAKTSRTHGGRDLAGYDGTTVPERSAYLWRLDQLEPRPIRAVFRCKNPTQSRRRRAVRLIEIFNQAADEYMRAIHSMMMMCVVPGRTLIMVIRSLITSTVVRTWSLLRLRVMFVPVMAFLMRMLEGHCRTTV